MYPYSEEIRAMDQAWLAERPECVRRLAERFSLRATLIAPDRFRVPMHVIGYTEEGHVILSAYDPLERPELAYATRDLIAASTLGDAQVLPRSTDA